MRLLKLKTSYSAKVIAACGFVTLTALFYTCLGLIKLSYRHMHRKLQGQFEAELRQKMLSYYEHHGKPAPLVYVGDDAHPVQPHNFPYAAEILPKGVLLALNQQNTNAWRLGYRVPMPNFTPPQRSQIDPLSSAPHQFFELQKDFPFQLVTFWPQRQELADDFNVIAPHEIDSLIDDDHDEIYYKTEMTLTYASPIEVYLDRARMIEQAGKRYGGSGLIAPPPLLIASCPKSQSDDSSLYYRTALPQLLNRYFTHDQLKEQSPSGSGAALYLPSIPIFRGCRNDGFPFLSEPKKFDCIATAFSSADERTQSCEKALECALSMQAFHKRPLSIGQEAQYQELIIPINNVSDVITWYELLSKPEAKYFRKFSAVHYTFTDDAVMEAFQMQLHELSLPPLPPPPTALERAREATTLTEEQKEALRKAGKTALDVSATAGRVSFTVLTVAGRLAYGLGEAAVDAYRDHNK